KCLPRRFRRQRTKAAKNIRESLAQAQAFYQKDWEDIKSSYKTGPFADIPTSPSIPPSSSSSEKMIGNSVGMKLTLIPAGEFPMGSPDSDGQAAQDEKPQGRVRITQPFYMGIYPVTQAEYERVMGKSPSTFKGDKQRPVEGVSWKDAMVFCKRLSKM